MPECDLNALSISVVISSSKNLRSDCLLTLLDLVAVLCRARSEPGGTL